MLQCHAVHFDASVGAYDGARGATYAVVRILHKREMIASVVDLFGLKHECVGWASHNAKVATLAAVFIDCHCAFYFCHIVKACIV